MADGVPGKTQRFVTLVSPRAIAMPPLFARGERSSVVRLGLPAALRSLPRWCNGPHKIVDLDFGRQSRPSVDAWTVRENDLATRSKMSFLVAAKIARWNASSSRSMLCFLDRRLLVFKYGGDLANVVRGPACAGQPDRLPFEHAPDLHDVGDFLGLEWNSGFSIKH